MKIRTTSLTVHSTPTRLAKAPEFRSTAPKDSFSFSKSEDIKFWAKAAPFSLAGLGLGGAGGAFVGKVVGRGLGEVLGQGANFQGAGALLGGVVGAVPGGYLGTFVGVSMQI